MKYLNQPEKDTEYMVRVGAYGLLLNESNQLAVIKTSTGYFLPGGGLEKDEDLEECLLREFVEEAATQVKTDEKIAEIGHYFYSTTLNTPMLTEGHFYKCFFIKKLESPCEEDHELVWLSLAEASEKLYLDNQRAAVNMLEAK